MSRADYYSTLRAVRYSLNDPVFQDRAVPPNPLNLGPQAIRRGIAVSAFNMLEDYLELTLRTTLDVINSSKFSFSALPPLLQNFLSLEAVSGLNNRLRFLRGQDRRVFLDNNLPIVSSYLSKSPKYTAFGFRTKGSNIVSEDVGRILSALGYKKAWTRASELSQRLSLLVGNPLQTYTSLSGLRNRCAHNSSYEMPISNLRTAIENCVSLSILLDVMMSEVGQAYKKRGIIGPPSNIALDISVRFIDEQPGGSYVERLGPAGPIIKRHPDRSSAITAVNARKAKRHTIIRDESLIPVQLLD